MEIVQSQQESKILIPETVIRDRDNKTDLFKLNGVISDSDEINCKVNNNLHTTNSSMEEEESQPEKKYKYFLNKSESGLSGGAIAAIIIITAVVIISLLVLVYYVKTGQCLNNKKGMQNTFSQDKMNSTDNL